MVFFVVFFLHYINLIFIRRYFLQNVLTHFFPHSLKVYYVTTYIKEEGYKREGLKFKNVCCKKKEAERKTENF